jgi:hypothetical protein
LIDLLRPHEQCDEQQTHHSPHRADEVREFRKHGGKLLIFHGTADPIFSALESIDYYQLLTRNNGGADATATWARLFLVPGMNHCAGGPATDSFGGLGSRPNSRDIQLYCALHNMHNALRKIGRQPRTALEPVPSVWRRRGTHAARLSQRSREERSW